MINILLVCLCDCTKQQQYTWNKVRLCKCSRLPKRAAGVRDRSSHSVYTVNNRAYSPESRFRWRWAHVCVCTVCEWLYVFDFPESVLLCLCLLAFNTGVTVETALLRRRPAILLWADIRASMSSSVSSSENSCGWQNSDLIKRKMASGKLAKAYCICTLHSFPHSSHVWVDAASFHKFNQTSRDRVW